MFSRVCRACIIIRTIFISPFLLGLFRPTWFIISTGHQARPERGGGTGAICPRPPNYIASLLCRESVDGSQEAVGECLPTSSEQTWFFFISQTVFSASLR